jgi:hypothetical protein
MLGRAGASSTAFAIGRGRVLKITDLRDWPAIWFANYIKRQPNAHWPRIHRQIRRGVHLVTWMERLFPLKAAGEAAVSQADDPVLQGHHLPLSELELYAELSGSNEPWQRTPRRVRRPLLDCHKAAEQRGLQADGKRQAWMRRPGGIIVLVDPFLEKSRPKRRFVAMEPE